MNNPRVTGIELYPYSGTIKYQMKTDTSAFEAAAILPFGVDPIEHQPDSHEIAVILAHILHLSQVNQALQQQVLDLQKAVTELVHRVDAKADKQPTA